MKITNSDTGVTGAKDLSAIFCVCPIFIDVTFFVFPPNPVHSYAFNYAEFSNLHLGKRWISP